MTATAVVVGAGPVGLATAMLLAHDGYEVTVVEKDARPVPVSAAGAWEQWERTGVAQFRQTHFMQAKFRHLLDAEFRPVRDRIEELGGRRFSLLSVLPPSVAGARRDGDERFDTLTARRPVIECAFAQLAEDTRGVKVLRGVCATGPVTGPSARPEVPHVAGVRTTDGAEISADLVVDAMGRRSKLGEWVASVGGRPPYEEVSDTGFAYYTRHFRSRDGALPQVRGPLSTAVGTVLCLTVPADNNTWSVTIVAMAGDKPLKELRHNAVWERVARAIPHASHWLDGEPLCDVMPMAGALDRRRRVVVDGQPAVTGLVPVADAWACTNPTAARGLSLGLAHAVTLRDVLRLHPADPAEFTLSFDRVTEETLTPWYREQVDRDQQRSAAIKAVIDGRHPGHPGDDRGRQMQAAFLAAASADPDAVRALMDVTSCLSLPGQVMSRPGLAEKVTAFLHAEVPATPGPTRSELLALTN
jgi:2-polyprenyl-6-methoxyphenol hydroxylase-like FAD-dependent oxidoreductase